MEIAEMRLSDYRNYAEQQISLKPGINVLIGGNAQGKTNVLEAIRLCSIGRSHRTTRDRELIERAHRDARSMLAYDPALEACDMAPLRREVERVFKSVDDDAVKGG